MSLRNKVNFTWRWAANLVLMAGMAGCTSWVLLHTFARKNEAVVVAYDQVEVITPKVKMGGTFQYDLGLERLESCPGVVIETYYALGDMEGQSVTTRRPANTFVVQRYPRTRFSVQLPQGVTPGKWRMTRSLESHECASGHVGPDVVASMEFEVTP